MSTIRVEVTEEDIRKKKRGHPLLCPIARALDRATGGWWRVGYSYVCRLGTLNSIPLPSDVQRWIRAFDKGARVAPFAFDLEVPE